jgi:hypothetical protein
MTYTWSPMNIELGKTAGGGGKLIPNPKLKLRSPFHEVMRFKHLSERTETAYWQWVVRDAGLWRDVLSPSPRPAPPGEGEWPSAPDAYDDFSGSKAAGSWGGEDGPPPWAHRRWQPFECPQAQWASELSPDFWTIPALDWPDDCPNYGEVRRPFPLPKGEG